MRATIGTHLEAERLHHRAVRIEKVIAALKDRALYRDAVAGATPPALERAIADFGIELRAIRQPLAELA